MKSREAFTCPPRLQLARREGNSWSFILRKILRVSEKLGEGVSKMWGKKLHLVFLPLDVIPTPQP